MPDPFLILQAIAASGGLAAAILLVCGWPWKSPRPRLANAGSAIGVGVGFLVGCLILGLTPHWPPREDVDRWLLFLLPAVIGAEAISAVAPRRKWLAWLVRGLVAIAAGRILLHGTIYIAELPGATRKWSVAEAWLYLAGMAAALAAAWVLILWLANRAPSRAVPLSVALASAAAAVTIMLSGYATGGQMGLPLSAALAAVTMASLALPKSTHLYGALGVGIVGLFALLVVGRFFGELTTARAALLFLAPLGCWVVELPYLRTFKPWQRGLLQLFVVSLPLIFVVVQAQRQFAADSQRNKASGDASADEYLNYGK
jgi:hypothetical protein